MSRNKNRGNAAEVIQPEAQVEQIVEAQVSNETVVQIEEAIVGKEVDVPIFDYASYLHAHKNKSAVIRALASEGKSCKEIYGLLKTAGVTNNSGDHAIRYQHVRNVLNTPVKKTA